MGGYGSGRIGWGNGKATTEAQKSIPVFWLKKQGWLEAGTIIPLSWTRRGVKTGSILCLVEKDRLTLNYRYKRDGGEWEQVEEIVYLERTPCNYGGTRTWFLCPQCGKRVGVLYGAGKFFLCRHCHQLTYAAQQETISDRLMRKQRKIRERLGADMNLFMPVLFKPKGMHQKTFDRLRMEEARIGYHADIMIGRRLGINFDDLQ